MLLGAICLFGASIKVEDLKTLKVHPHDKMYPIPLSVGTGLLMTGVMLLIFADRFTTAARVSGRWEYSVCNALGEFSHKGEMLILQRGRRLGITGTRRFMCRVSGQKVHCDRVSIIWTSKWAAMCHDGILRFEYHIDLPEGKMEATCRLNPNSRKPSSMSGHYHMLPPFDHSSLNARFGTIEMRKLGADEDIATPYSEDGSQQLSDDDNS